MPSLLSNSLSGLLTARSGIETVSHNISNVNTDGYVRQRTVQAARPPEFSGAGYVGTGAAVIDIQRVYDSFLVDQARGAATDETYLSSFHDLATRVDQLFGNQAAGLSNATSDFFDAVDALARDPSSLPARQTVISQANTLTTRFATLDNQLEAIGEEVDGRLLTGVQQINALSVNIAKLNDKIASSLGAPADLLDQRDQLLNQLAEQIDVSVLNQADGAISVFVGSGQPLVTGTRSFQLSVVRDQFDPARLQIGFGDYDTPIPDGQTGGAIGGALEFRRTLLDPARAELGRIATGISVAFNAVHATGMDLSGNAGTEFFSLAAPETLPSSANTGTASVSMVIEDIGALQPRNYELTLGGGAWQLNDVATDEVISMTGSGTPADPFRAEGLAFTVTAGALDNDRFQLRPLTPAASGIAVAINAPEKLAAASPLVGNATLNNSGDGSAGVVSVTDPANPALKNSVQIIFDDPATYRIYDAGGTDLTGPLPFSAGTEIEFNGWSFALGGQPAAGDSFGVKANLGGSGDNSVARRLLSVARDKLFGGGNTSVEDLQSGLLATVGVATQQARISFEAQSAIRQQAEMSVDSVSGVNLDEEAINLMRYQEAYQAAARAISIADSLFQSVLDAMR